MPAFGPCNNPRVSPIQRKRPVGLAVFLVVAGIVGFIAAWALTLDKFLVLANPSATLGCNINPTVQCGKNLAAPQGSVFGFPNPILGIAGFVAPIVVGAAIIAGARFARWFWMLFNLGVIGAFVFVCWLIGQSILVLGTLCPWCLVVWSVTIPLFWAVTLYNLGSGNIPIPERGRKFFRAAYGWTPLITLLSYVAVGALAQVRLDIVALMFG
jgi:uncharacterized membrane protein